MSTRKRGHADSAGSILTALACTGSELVVPVLVGDRMVGQLDVENESTDAFSDVDRRLFERIASELGPLFE